MSVAGKYEAVIGLEVHMQLLTEVIDHLFKDYMSRRLTKQFADEMVRMSEWLEAKSKNSL